MNEGGTTRACAIALTRTFPILIGSLHFGGCRPCSSFFPSVLWATVHIIRTSNSATHLSHLSQLTLSSSRQTSISPLIYLVHADDWTHQFDFKMMTCNTLMNWATVQFCLYLNTDYFFSQVTLYLGNQTGLRVPHPACLVWAYTRVGTAGLDLVISFYSTGKYRVNKT